jgi:prevent-host-death family protein
VNDGTYNVHQTKTHLSRLLKRVAGGDEIVIAKYGTPIARLVPFDALRAHDRTLGELGVKLARDLQRGEHDPDARWAEVNDYSANT